MSRLPRPAALAALALTLGTAGCMKNTYVTNRQLGGGIYTQKASFYLWGLVGEKTVDLHQVCPGGVAWFQNRMSVGDSLVGCITCGLYEPVTIEVRCAGGQAYLAVPDVPEGVTWFYALDDQGAPIDPLTAGPVTDGPLTDGPAARATGGAL